MTLAQAVQAYRERCQLFVWDVHEVLVTRYKVPYRLLQHMAEVGKALSIGEICLSGGYLSHGGTAVTRRKNSQRACQFLWEQGLLHRQWVPALRGYTYTLTDLGALVIACDAPKGGHHVRPSSA
jgi:hypothetical protein